MPFKCIRNVSIQEHPHVFGIEEKPLPNYRPEKNSLHNCLYLAFPTMVCQRKTNLQLGELFLLVGVTALVVA